MLLFNTPIFLQVHLLVYVCFYKTTLAGAPFIGIKFNSIEYKNNNGVLSLLFENGDHKTIFKIRYMCEINKYENLLAMHEPFQQQTILYL